MNDWTIAPTGIVNCNLPERRTQASTASKAESILEGANGF